MKKILAFIAAVALSVVALGSQAQKPSPGKMGGKMSAKPMAMAAAPKKGVTGTSTGTVKSAPSGSTFVLKAAKTDATVDISGAKIRNGSGQFVKADKITAGAPAEATGTWKGRTLFATSVTLTALKADKPAPKGPAGKMGGAKMGGAKMGGVKTAK